MDEEIHDTAEDEDLRYTCPICGRMFPEPTPDWTCPTCNQTLRIAGALRLRSRTDVLRKARNPWG